MFTPKNLSITLLLSAALLAGAGCQKADDPILGVWKGKADAMGVPTDVTYNFKADKTFTCDLVIDVAKSKVTFAMTGTYESNGKEVKFAPKDVQVLGGTPQIQKLFTLQSKAEMTKPYTMTTKFEGNKMVGVSDGITVTYTKN
jgi:hypothetical protein